MRKRQSRKVLVILRELRQARYGPEQLFPDNVQAFTHQDDIRIISDIAGSRPEMNDAFRLRALQAVSIDMGHDIMPHFGLTPLRIFIIDIVRMLSELVKLFVCNRKSQFLLGLRQRDPKAPPGAEFPVPGKQFLHLPACIPLRQRTHIYIIHNLLHGACRCPQSDRAAVAAACAGSSLKIPSSRADGQAASGSGRRTYVRNQ